MSPSKRVEGKGILRGLIIQGEFIFMAAMGDCDVNAAVLIYAVICVIGGILLASENPTPRELLQFKVRTTRAA